jgi:hypothetical protein
MCKDQNSALSTSMVKIPSYLECYAKFVSYLGLDYSEKEKTTDKFRTAELRDFSEQGDRYTNHYFPKILNLFAGEDKEKQAAIKVCLIMSESLARFLTSKNYYTIASNKRATWALLIFYYIPHLACLISFYKEEFGIPECLVESDFMLPYSEAGKVVLPTERLKRYLNPIKKNIPTVKDTENNFLAKYLYKFDKTVIPSYQTQQRIVNQLKNVIESDEKINEIGQIFRASIVSGRVYNELLDMFGEGYALALVEYFKKCLITSDRLIKEATLKPNAFEHFFAFYVAYYRTETLYTVAELNRSVEFVLEPFHNNSIGYEELKDEREGYRERLFLEMNSFLYTTTSTTRDQLDEIDTDNLTNGILRFSILEEAESLDEDHEHIVSLVTKLEYIFSSPGRILRENEIDQIFHEIEHHKFYSIYEHEYWYYAGLSDLGRNEFEKALEKLKLARQKCMSITAGETQLNISKLMIVLRLITDNKVSYSHLNSEIKMMIDSEPEESLAIFSVDMDQTEPPEQLEIFESLEYPELQELYKLPPLSELREQCEKFRLSEQPKLQEQIELIELVGGPDQPDKDRNKQIYLNKTLNLIKSFNTEDYCHYEGFDCVQYNPFQKLDALIGDIYLRYNSTEFYSESEETKMTNVIKSLMKGKNAKYPFEKNLITLFQYKAIDVFEILNFIKIQLICLDFEINAKNISNLADNPKMLKLISDTIKKLRST